MHCKHPLSCPVGEGHAASGIRFRRLGGQAFEQIHLPVEFLNQWNGVCALRGLFEGPDDFAVVPERAFATALEVFPHLAPVGAEVAQQGTDVVEFVGGRDQPRPRRSGG